MDSDSVTQLLSAEFPGCNIKVDGGDGKYLVTAVGDIFQGLNPVKRQQMIYQVLNPHIASGVIHAVTMRLYTNDEFNAG